MYPDDTYYYIVPGRLYIMSWGPIKHKRIFGTKRSDGYFIIVKKTFINNSMQMGTCVISFLEFNGNENVFAAIDIGLYENRGWPIQFEFIKPHVIY